MIRLRRRTQDSTDVDVPMRSDSGDDALAAAISELEVALARARAAFDERARR